MSKKSPKRGPAKPKVKKQAVPVPRQAAETETTPPRWAVTIGILIRHSLSVVAVVAMIWLAEGFHSSALETINSISQPSSFLNPLLGIEEDEEIPEFGQEEEL